MAITWDREAFKRYYHEEIRDPRHPKHGQRITYGRDFAQRLRGPLDDDITEFRIRAAKVIEEGNLSEGDSVLVVGSGFGFLVEALRDEGMAAYGTDSSRHINQNLRKEARGDALEYLSGADVRDYEADEPFDLVVTESVLEGYSPDEMESVLDACERLGESVMHLVYATERLPREMTGMKIEGWRAIRPSHLFVNLEGL